MKIAAAAVVACTLSLGLAHAATAPARPPAACCRVAAGAVVQVALAQDVGTKTYKTGDTFALRLATPLIVGGKVVLREGTPGVGEVIESSGPGMGGKAAKMVLAARYLTHGRAHLPLDALQLSAGGKNRVAAANIIGVSGLILGPIGFVGMAVPGNAVLFPAGTVATAKLAGPAVLASLGPPTGRELALARKAGLPTDQASADGLSIPPPPHGMGQVVFFRPHSILGTGQWFNVREGGQALGKLTNGAYFIQRETPGVHEFTAKEEPEFKDSLRLQVDPGETYFVKGELTKGVVIGAAALTPSDRAGFDAAGKAMTPVYASK